MRWSPGLAARQRTTATIYYLAHALVIAIGTALTLLHNTAGTAIGTSLIATGAAGIVIYLYIARTDKTRDAIEMLSGFGLAQVYQRRAAQIRDQYAVRLEKARSNVDILGFGLKDFRRDYMTDLAALATRAVVRILLIDPESSACSMRDKEEDQREGTISEEVRDFTAQFTSRYGAMEQPRLSIRYYTCLPLVNIFRIDNEIFWGPYLVGHASGNTITMRVTRGIIYDQLMEHFNEIWENYSRPVQLEQYGYVQGKNFSFFSHSSRPIGSRQSDSPHLWWPWIHGRIADSPR